MADRVCQNLCKSQWDREDVLKTDRVQSIGLVSFGIGFYITTSLFFKEGRSNDSLHVWFDNVRMSVSKLRSIAAWASGIPNDFPRMVLFWALESLGFIGGLEKVQVSNVSKFLMVVPSISWVSLVLKVVAYFHPQIDYLFGISSLFLMVFAFFFRQAKRKPTPYSLEIVFVQDFKPKLEKTYAVPFYQATWSGLSAMLLDGSHVAQWINRWIYVTRAFGPINPFKSQIVAHFILVCGEIGSLVDLEIA